MVELVRQIPVDVKARLELEVDQYRLHEILKIDNLDECVNRTERVLDDTCRRLELYADVQLHAKIWNTKEWASPTVQDELAKFRPPAAYVYGVCLLLSRIKEGVLVRLTQLSRLIRAMWTLYMLAQEKAMYAGARPDNGYGYYQCLARALLYIERPRVAVEEEK